MTMTTQVYGTPARHARRLRWQAQLQTLGAASIAAAGVLALLTGTVLPAPAAAACIVGGGAFAQPSRRRWLQAAAGIRSEDRVARILSRSGAVAVVHGADLAPAGRSRGDVDHVVLGPVAAAVETKTGQGKVRVRGEQLQVGRRTLPGRPLHQARIHARQLERHTGTSATAVLCVVDMVGRPVTVGDVTVCSLADLPGVLATLPRVLDTGAAGEIARRLPLAD
jgi:hypothetical protein